MQATIKSLHLENFKGVKSEDGKRENTYVFDDKNATVLGQNGTGKTTIADAYFWALSDKNYALSSNPDIRPLGVEEVTPRVEIVFDVEGRKVEIAKIQKCTKKTKNGIETTSLSNSYEVNSVEYGERDFKKKMAELGFDFDLFLPLSHPDVFTSQKSADMRKVLFGMASEKSDYEIACNTKGAQNVALLLENYTAEEVKAMQSATLRKIREEYGKDGEILRAKIEGMEQSKTDIDVAELELHHNALNEQIAESKSKIEDISKVLEEHNEASNGIFDLQFKLTDLQRKANEELDNNRRELREKINDICQEIKELNKQIGLNDRDIGILEEYIRKHTGEIEKCCDDWNRISGEEMREESVVCPTCHREMPEDFRKKYVSEFEKSKKDRLALVSQKGNEMKDRIKQDNAEIEQIKATKAENENEKEKKEEELSALEKELDNIPQSIDISDRPEVQEIQRQIAEKEQAMNKSNSAEEIRQQLKDDGEDLQSQLTEVEKQLALAQKNVEIDEDISKLREKQKSFEQQKADCEKILYQLDLVSRKKNELLTEDINKNFDIVKWQMFEYQKNGDYKDCCIPTIDGKRFGESTNTGREVLAKLDIIKGLQRFYGQNYPVFLDGAECLSDETVKRIEMDCQLILLKVPQVVIPPIETREDMADEEWERAVAEWERQKKKIEDYYKELKIEMEG